MRREREGWRDEVLERQKVSTNIEDEDAPRHTAVDDAAEAYALKRCSGPMGG